MLLTLPEEIILFVLTKFGPRDLCLVAALCKELYNLANDEELWKQIALSSWRRVLIRRHVIDAEDGGTDFHAWKAFHIERTRIQRNWAGEKCKKYALKGGHYGTVFCVQIMDERHLASIGEDGSLQIWDYVTRKHVLSHAAHNSSVLAMHYDRPTNIFITGAFDQEIRVWRYNSSPRTRLESMSIRELKQLLASHSISSHDCFEKTDLVTKAFENRLVPTMERRQVLKGHGGTIVGVHFDSAKQKLASASFDETAKMWDLTTEKCIQTYRGHTAPVNAVQFDDTKLLTCSNDARVCKWDVNTGQLVSVFQGHVGWVWALQYSGEKLWSASVDHTVRLWDMNTCTPVSKIMAHDGEVPGLCVDFEENKMVTAGFDGKVFYWDLRQLSRPRLKLQLDTRCTRVQFNDDIIATATFKNMVHMWDFSCTE